MGTIGPAIRPELRQRPTLGQRTRLFLHVLQVTRIELGALVEETLAENPCIEEPTWQRGTPSFTDRGELDLDDLPAPPPSLLDELRAQLGDVWLSTLEQEVAEFIIGNLDDNGFLDATIEEIAAQAGVPDVAIVERVLACVQELDPPGIAARDLAECFLLQLRRRGFRDDSLAIRLVREHLPTLARRPLERVADTLGATLRDVRDAAQVLARLDRSPGRRAAELLPRLEPDMSAAVVDGDVVVGMNEEAFPRLRLREDPAGGPALAAWRTSAKWLVDALEQRRATLHAVTSSIMRAQRDFLAGSAPLQPLVLRDVAADVGRHESTVSRAIADKYVQTPQGVLPLRAFFARRVNPRDDTTAAEVKGRIVAIVADEDRSRPSSDDEIARRLAGERLRVSRRTVAKYREELGLPVAAVRSSASYATAQHARDGAAQRRIASMSARRADSSAGSAPGSA